MHNLFRFILHIKKIYFFFIWQEEILVFFDTQSESHINV